MSDRDSEQFWLDIEESRDLMEQAQFDLDALQPIIFPRSSKLSDLLPTSRVADDIELVSFQDSQQKVRACIDNNGVVWRQKDDSFISLNPEYGASCPRRSIDDLMENHAVAVREKYVRKLLYGREAAIPVIAIDQEDRVHLRIFRDQCVIVNKVSPRWQQVAVQLAISYQKTEEAREKHLVENLELLFKVSEQWMMVYHYQEALKGLPHPPIELIDKIEKYRKQLDTEFDQLRAEDNYRLFIELERHLLEDINLKRQKFESQRYKLGNDAGPDDYESFVAYRNLLQELYDSSREAERYSGYLKSNKRKEINEKHRQLNIEWQALNQLELQRRAKNFAVEMDQLESLSQNLETSIRLEWEWWQLKKAKESLPLSCEISCRVVTRMKELAEKLKNFPRTKEPILDVKKMQTSCSPRDLESLDLANYHLFPTGTIVRDRTSRLWTKIAIGDGGHRWRCQSVLLGHQKMLEALARHQPWLVVRGRGVEREYLFTVNSSFSENIERI